MKNRVNLSGNASFTIDDTPVTIENFSFSYESECTPAELVTSAGFAKELLKEFKRSFKDFEVTPKKVEEPAELPTGTFTGGEPIETKPEFKLDLKGSFEVLETKLIQTEAWDSDGYGNIRWISTTDDNKEIQISLDKRCIDMHFYHFASEPVHIHVYEDRTRYTGIAGIYAEKFFKNLGVPGADEIFKMLSKVKEAD